jgi:predicted AlkP superfamily phosphohydrolase/phosphomutase
MIILGFDGVDPNYMNRLMDEGQLPNLARLKEMGDYHLLGSTIPPQSPVAWSTFATGVNPGGHGIYDFINRTPENYVPGVATMFLRQPELLFGIVPTKKAHGEVTRGGISFWKVAADSGIHATMLTIPYTFPAENVGPGRMLCGLGVPDLRETNSTFTYMATDLTSEELAEPVGGGKLVKVKQINGEIADYLEAAILPGKTERARIPINFTIRGADEVEIRLNGQSVILKAGNWTEWVSFHYKAAPLLKVTGICRFFLFTAAPEFRLYVSPLNIDPSNPYIDISYPPTFAQELFEKVGYFKTVGWAYDTSALNEERLTDEQFLEDMKHTTAERERIFLHELEKRDWDLFIGVFTDTDRAAHMFWRFIDPLSPFYNSPDAQKYGDAIAWTYRHMDDFVGKVMDHYLDDQTVLLVLSDHGFHSFRRGFNTNTWLVKNGYMFLKGMEKLKPGDEIPANLFTDKEFFQNVVWRKTRAYALGTGQIYINLMGREGQGIVKPGAEYDQLLEEIKNGLLAQVDPVNGQPIFKAIYKCPDVYKGEFMGKSPDLQLGFSDGYRTSKETMLGGVPPEILSNNLSKWSGDHSASAMEDTPGILFANVKIEKDDPTLLDFAPTVLEYFGLQKLPVMEGDSFLKIRAQKTTQAMQ